MQLLTTILLSLATTVFSHPLATRQTSSTDQSFYIQLTSDTTLTPLYLTSTGTATADLASAATCNLTSGLLYCDPVTGDAIGGSHGYSQIQLKYLQGIDSINSGWEIVSSDDGTEVLQWSNEFFKLGTAEFKVEETEGEFQGFVYAVVAEEDIGSRVQMDVELEVVYV